MSIKKEIKPGMTVRRIEMDRYINGESVMRAGEIGVVDRVDGSNIYLKGQSHYHYSGCLEIVDQPVFDMKTLPWVIRTKTKEEYDAANEWLNKVHGWGVPTPYRKTFIGLSNTTDRGTVYQENVMWMDRDDSVKRHEIKLSFKTTVDYAEYPVVKSEEDLKKEEQKRQLAELQQSIRDAQKKADELQKSIGG